jgi:apoptosis-inducing factor 3
MEIHAGKFSDLPDGGKKMFSHQGNDILLVKIQGKVHALGGHCTHYGAPLDEGVLDGDRLICPWHHAVFQATTGDLLDPPALDALPRYEVKVKGDDIYVILPERIESNRLPAMAGYNASKDNRCFVILGAGAAGTTAAQTLREDGFQGRIVLISHENYAAYDRPTLSKAYLAGGMEKESLRLRPEKFYQDHDLELRLGQRVTEVLAKAKVVKFADGKTLKFDKLLIATGGNPRKLDVPGSDLGNIFRLRSLDDCEAIISALSGAERAAVIGASFIGMESAASIAKRKKIPVTVIGLDTIPFEKVFGGEIGALFQSAHEKHGAAFKLGRTVQRFEGNGKVEAVILDNGERVAADLIIVGVGVRPATHFQGDLDLQLNGSLKVDRCFRVSEAIYAAGDVATFTDWRTGQDLRIEHWRTAMQQGRVAAHNMAGREVPFEGLPFFWTSQAGLGLRYVGYAKEWDEIIVQGSIPSQEFVAFYVKGDQIQAAAGNKRDQVMDAVHELMRTKRMPSVTALRQNRDLDLVALT